MKKILLSILLLSGIVNYAQDKQPKTDKPSQQSGDLIIESYQGELDLSVSQEDNKIYNVTDVAAEFPGGFDTFRKQLASKIDTKKFADIGTGSLKVLLKFIIEKDGSVGTIQIVKDPGYGAGREAARALKSSNAKWLPAKVAGKPVRSYYSIPIVIVVPTEQKAQADTNDIPMPVETIPAPEKVPETEAADNSIYNANMLEVQPVFPGGKEGLVNFINKNVKKQNLEAVTAEKEIKVFIQFIVEKDGTITNHKIVEAPNTGIMKEVLRVLTLLKTKWSPGIHNGKPVRALYSTQVIIKVPQQ